MMVPSGVFLVLMLCCMTQGQNLPDLITKKIQNLIANGKIKRDVPLYTEPELKEEEEYDFIIVGAGSAGSTLVNRLSEVQKWKVLLLEAGGEPRITTDVPMLAALAQFSEQNWEFFTEKEDNFALDAPGGKDINAIAISKGVMDVDITPPKGLRGQRMHWPRGKGLGGSSLLNYMVVSRGARQDYDRWASLGNPGWSYDEVLPYLKKIETCKVKHQDHKYRGDAGEIHVEDISRHTKGAEAFIEAAKFLGYKYVDYNGEEHVGASYIQLATKNGLRCSGERCFVRKAKDRPNLTIRTYSHVTKIIIDNNKRARGVEFVKNGKLYKAYATKEVVLSAGVINSAHILMLSGVGPKQHLEKFDINVIQNLPVGKKMYDHIVYYGLTFYSDEMLSYNASVLFDDQHYIDLYNKGDGPLHNSGSLEAVVFATTELAHNKNLSDVEILYWGLHPGGYEDYSVGRSVGISSHIYDKVYRPIRDKNLFSALVMLLHPESYGHIELRSKDPFDYPKLYSGYFTDPEGQDMKVMITGIKEALRIFDAKPFKKYDVKLIDTPVPGCEHFAFGSDEYWDCAIRHTSTTVYHHTTTCKMGPKNDPEAVVDHKLRIYGIDGLRVADTSIIPVQITGHTNIPAHLVGEMAASLIKADYEDPYNIKSEL